jgi:hypothetical protein
MNLLSLSDNDDAFECFLSRLEADSPLYPQNIDKVKSLLKKIENDDDSTTINNQERNFYRRMLKPHFKELSNSDDETIQNELKLVPANSSPKRKEKVIKLSDNIANSHRTGALDAQNSTKSESNLVPLESIITMLVKSAHSEQLLQENFKNILHDFCALQDEKEWTSVCDLVIKELNTDAFNNVISFLKHLPSWEELEGLKLFVENIVFKYITSTNLDGNDTALLQLIDLVPKDEKFVVEQFAIPFIAKSNLSNLQILAYITQMVLQLQNAEHKTALLAAYLKSSNEEICNESQVNLMDAMISSDNSNAFEEIPILELLSSYILVSMQNNAKSTINFNKNTRFGKFLLCVMKNLPPEIPSTTYAKLSQIADFHNSFLKKKISAELKTRRSLI